MTAKIIQFPTKNKRVPARTAEEINLNLFEARVGLAEYLTDEIMSDAYAMMHNHNVPMALEDGPVKSMGFLQEAIKAAILAMWGIKHPFHKVANQIFTVEKDSDGDRILKLHADGKKMSANNTVKQ